MLGIQEYVCGTLEDLAIGKVSIEECLFGGIDGAVGADRKKHESRVSG